jgi:predicted SnoaL-like aldol condensation-catalyzing enzyme
MQSLVGKIMFCDVKRNGEYRKKEELLKMKKKLFYPFLSVFLCFLLGACSEQSKETTAPKEEQAADTQENKATEAEPSNKEKAVTVLESFETGDTSAIMKWISPDNYIQHNLDAPNGRDALLGIIGQLEEGSIIYEAVRVLEDGDYVVVQSEISFFGSKQVVFDIFRFENGLIVEHWDNIQELAPPNPSGHTMIDGPTEITDLDKTEANKELIRKFAEDVFLGKNPEAFPTYFNGDNYIQHNPFFGDGLSTVMEAFQELAEQDGDFGYTNVHMILGEGNFVLIVSEAMFNDMHTAVYDLYRVENGKIAEHWDVIQEIPPKDQWQNENGKF